MQHVMFVFVKNDFVRTGARIIGCKYDVIHIRTKQKISTHLVLNFSLHPRLEGMERVVRLEKDYCRWDRRVEFGLRKNNRDCITKLLELESHLPRIAFGRIADHGEVSGLKPYPGFPGLSLVSKDKQQK